jgi:ABC-type multidrug transport system ATPase subunit
MSRFKFNPASIALVGSNGAGKTTLMRCLLGEYYCEGTITIDGLNPRTHRQAVLARVGFVPQLPPPLKMPVAQLIQFAAGVCGTDLKRITEVTTICLTVEHQTLNQSDMVRTQDLITSET